MNNTTEISNRDPVKKERYPRWVVPVVLTLAFVLIHILAPLGLSLLSRRYGWSGGRPGAWNLLALLLVIPGISATLWMIPMHYRASPETFTQFQQSRNLITPGSYSFSRNPMYVAELTFWLGWALFYGSVTVFAGFLLWFAMFNFWIVPYEERDLEARFGEAYRQYKQSVPRWLGRLRR